MKEYKSEFDENENIILPENLTSLNNTILSLKYVKQLKFYNKSDKIRNYEIDGEWNRSNDKTIIW